MQRSFFLFAVLIGCANDPLQQDMKMFCRAADVEGARDVMHIVPYVADRMKTDELKTLMLTIRNENTTAREFLAAGDALAKKAGIDDCQTVKVLLKYLQQREQEGR